jgi:hypothetical protein
MSIFDVTEATFRIIDIEKWRPKGYFGPQVIVGPCPLVLRRLARGGWASLGYCRQLCGIFRHAPALVSVYIDAVRYGVEHDEVLNACWNSVCRKISYVNKWKYVLGFICGLGHLDPHNIKNIS